METEKSKLKYFQSLTVDRVVELFKNGQNRVLISDEVGLGKTVVARGIIEKLVTNFDVNKYKQKEYRVVYICSNQNIASQNMSKLTINNENSTLTSNRLSLQMCELIKRKSNNVKENVNVIINAITPGTSIDIADGYGKKEEREFIYKVLINNNDLIQKFTKEKLDKKLREILKGNANTFEVDDDLYYLNYENKDIVDKNILEFNNYINLKLNEKLVKEVIKTVDNKEVPCNDTLLNILKKEITCEENTYSYSWITGQLRKIFCEYSLKELNPDLIIMDEFQRFSYLLNNKLDNMSETSMIVEKFIKGEYRVLLLSATPYKMYATMDEDDEASPYEEFLDVMAYLMPQSKYKDFKLLWDEYSYNLITNTEKALELKPIVEKYLYSVMCRTERPGKKFKSEYFIMPKLPDVLEYIQLSNLINKINNQNKDSNLYKSGSIIPNVPVDYVKSCPYILSFMNRNYKFKDKIFKSNTKNLKLSKHEYDTLFLDYRKIIDYEKIDINNAKVEFLQNKIFQNNIAKFLWIPPLKPYYNFDGVFMINTNEISKTIIFSKWQMVPKMLSCLLSYEYERQTIGVYKKTVSKDKEPIKYINKAGKFTNKTKRKPENRLSFTKSDIKYNNLLLCYPFRALASKDLFDKTDLLNKHHGNISVSKLISDIEEKIKLKINKLILDNNIIIDDSYIDTSWYYKIPLLLEDNLNIKKDKKDLENIIYKYDNSKGTETYLQYINYILDEFLKFREDKRIGKKPKNLEKILAYMVLGSPAICLYRTLNNNFSLACLVSKDFINYMDTPEAISTVDISVNDPNLRSYQERVLKYCIDGNLQSMFDEYKYMIKESIFSDNSDELVTKISNIMRDSITVGSSLFDIDLYQNFKDKDNKKAHMRSNFAVSIYNMKDDSNNIISSEKIRNTFNSPFKPFVLATTSIAQEGLDFHTYCRNIWHYNIPSNAIDIEQREGRIDRYKSHAIRAAIVDNSINIDKFDNDVWNEMFSYVHENLLTKEEKLSGMYPYWCLPKTIQKNYINRYVPIYSYSIDFESYERKIEILNLYRLSIGQKRQEEIIKSHSTNIEAEKLFLDLSPYSRKITHK